MCFDSVIKIPQWEMREIKYKNAWDLQVRHKFLKDFYYYFEDLIRVVRGYPDVNFRHLISPLQDLGGGALPIFDGLDAILNLIERGEIDAEIHLEYF